MRGEQEWSEEMERVTGYGAKVVMEVAEVLYGYYLKEYKNCNKQEEKNNDTGRT